MPLNPKNAPELADALAFANAQRVPAGTVTLDAINEVVDYAPEDMTVTVQAGLRLRSLQDRLRQHGQWLPLDPPFPDSLSLAAVLDTNASGPRRYGYGTVREHLLGMQAVLADGRTVKSGGKVVKNVAGYDLHKLFVGAHGSLGIVVEVSLKLQPIPEKEAFVTRTLTSWEEAETLANAVLESELTPVVLDLHELTGVGPVVANLVVGFAGMREDVEWQLERAQWLGMTASTSLEYDREFAQAHPDAGKISTLPSRVCEVLASLERGPYVARLGNGLILHGAIPSPQNPGAPEQLSRRLKDTFDPNRILPELPS